MPTRLFHVDSFTSQMFAGNPAGVAFASPDLADDVRLSIAAELNLSETAFPTARPDGTWDLRWFTPTVEVDLCGHATLATAHVMFEDGIADGDTITFHTRSGELHCTSTDSGITMDFPTAPVEVCEPAPGLEDALGIQANKYGIGETFALVEVDSVDAVANLSPDLGALRKIDISAVIVTASGDVDDGEADFVSRVFGPKIGVPEDPVTGSAHCLLGPWWSGPLGKTTMLAHQVSARGGHLWVDCHDDRVILTGQAVTVFETQLPL